MKLPAFFGHKRSINLLPRDAFESSTLGIVLEWSLVFGKWAVILTQLVVMGAFLYRFSLDRQLTDLSKQIAKNVAIVKSYEDVERDFVLAQRRISKAKEVLSSQEAILKTVDSIASATPNQVWYDRLSISPEQVSMSAYVSSISGLGQFLNQINSNSRFKGVKIGKIESSSAKGALMQFDITVSLSDVSTIPKGTKK